MDYCDIKNPAEYTEKVERWSRQTDADGDEMGKVIEALVNNDNYLKKEVERQDNSVVVTLTVAGWSAAAPYAQRVEMPGVKETDILRLYTHTPKNLSGDAVKLRRKMTAMITDGEAKDGYVMFYCGEKKPTADFPVKLVGVSANE